MPGVLKLEGTNIATGDGNGAVTLSSEVTVPASVGSSMVLIKTITASGGESEIIFINGSNGVVIDSTYRNYKVIFSGLTTTTNDKSIYCRVGSSEGYDEGYRGAIFGFYDNGSSSSASVSMRSTTYLLEINDGVGAKSAGGMSGFIEMSNLHDSNFAAHYNFFHLHGAANGWHYGRLGQGTTVNNYTIDRIRFFTESDSFASDSQISLYGIKDA